MKERILAVDFDGTCVYPSDIGDTEFATLDVPHAERVLKRFVAFGWHILLWSCRKQMPTKEAIKWFMVRGIPLSGVNQNNLGIMHPLGREYFTGEGLSPKIFANLYIDDRTPLFYNKKYVDWLLVEAIILDGISVSEAVVTIQPSLECVAQC